MTGRRDCSKISRAWRSQAVAVLHIRSVPDALYRKLRARAKRERRSVAQEVIQILDQALAEPPRRERPNETHPLLFFLTGRPKWLH